MTAVIQTQKLTKLYGSRRGLSDIDLTVEQGEVFGFLGPNGAGKTTTLRILLDLIRPSSGAAYVFGIKTTVDPVAIHRRVGYLPGEFALYDRLTGAQTLQYLANLRGGVDRAYQAGLVDRFDLDPGRRFQEYSKGNKQKVGLIAALQHRPELLLLDEPTSTLDPLVQQSFLEVVQESADQGATVFLSSHILSEVERACTRVAIIRDGRLVRVDRIDALRDLDSRHVELRFADYVPEAEFARIPGVSDVRVTGSSLHLQVAGSIAAVVTEAACHDLEDFLSRETSLEATFLHEYGRRGAERGHRDG